MDAVLVDREDQLAKVLEALSSAEEIGLDVESNGLHAYRPALCTMQLATVVSNEVRAVFVVDTLALPGAALARLLPVLSSDGPRKLIHDLAFDVRILARHDLLLGNVIDTAIAARFLGLPSTGLAALLESKLGVRVSKELQHHDWGKRPLEPHLLRYLVDDVAHLPALSRVLFEEAAARDVVPEIEAETAHRLETALAARDDDDPRPPYVRIKGTAALDAPTLAVLRRVAEVRESAARRWDVPPFKVIGNDTLLELARKRPTEKLSSVRGLDRGRGASLVRELARAVAEGVRDGDIPADERANWFGEPKRLPRPEVEARRSREQRLTAWRRRVAKERGVDEQVVLPGHCLQDIVDAAPETLEALARIPGIGARRVERDGGAILAAVRGDRAE